MTTDLVYKKITITLPTETVQKLKKICKKDHRSQSNLILHLIEEYDKFKDDHSRIHNILEKNKD